jgi:hypothetical protein
MPEREREPARPHDPEPAGERSRRMPEQPPAARMLELQRAAGNRAVAAMLARHEDAAPAQATGGTGTAPALTQAAQEAEALDTWALLRAVHGEMLASTDDRIRNTGQMLNPPAERSEGRRMSARPMTLRADSAQLVADRGDNAAETAYFFYGSRQDNSNRHGPNTIGTIAGDSTVLVRGKLPGGTWQAHERIMGTLVHECSHILVKDYGEHPRTAGDAGSFDRFRDEFRAYFVEPHGNFDGLTGDARALAIRTHLVGTNATTGGYPDLRNAYWAGPAPGNAFRAQVDAHMRPDGFNLTNSPLLDRLVTLLRDEHAGRASAEDTIFQVAMLAPAERQEAAGATLIATLLGRLPAADAQRIRQALAAPAAVGYGREINPTGSAQVTAFLDAVQTKVPAQITEAYRSVPANDRGGLQLNAHLLSWLGRVLPNEQLLRTCVVCMVTGGSFAYYDRTLAFTRACDAAAGVSVPPEALRTALRALPLQVRLAYYRFCEDDYRTRVLPLEEPVRREVTAILRGDADA